MDEKPEKGERKMADEVVLLIADILDSVINSAVSSDKEKVHLHLFKICLLELAYEHSNYNFDLQVSLMKSFDALGLSVSFSESYESLGIKGVQLETLGYLWVSHSMKWLNFSQFNNVHNKYAKYLKFNSRDLGDIKFKACEEKNYGQLENFIEYEEFLGRSYFTCFAHEFHARTRNAINLMMNQSNQ